MFLLVIQSSFITQHYFFSFTQSHNYIMLSVIIILHLFTVTTEAITASFFKKISIAVLCFCIADVSESY